MAIDNKKGIVTLEVLMAFMIIILCMSAVIFVVFGNQSMIIDASINNEAIYKSKKMLEDLRKTSRIDFNLVNSSKWNETNGLITFTKNIDVRQVDYFTKQATSTVSWKKGVFYQSVILTTLITSPEFASMGKTCSSIISGDWKNPIITSYELGKDLLGDPSSPFPITAVDVYKGKLFVSVNNSSGNTSPTFFIFSLANPNTPTLLTSMDNDSTIKLGLNAISSTDSYSFVASAKQSNFGTCLTGICGQLQIIKTSTTPPTVIKTFKIPAVTGSAGQSMGQSIVYKKDRATNKEYVYLGLAKTQIGPEFNIIDVTNKSNPVYKGGFSVGNVVNSISINGNYAYISTPNSENVTILDISNPTNPIRVGGYSPTGGSNGKSIYKVGNNVYLGRTFGTNEFYILDASNPNSISLTASKDIGTGSNTSINSLIVRDYLAFMITNAKFEIWNISNTSNIFPWTQNGIASEFPDLAGGVGTTMDCEGNYVYVGSLPSNNKGFISVITAN